MRISRSSVLALGAVLALFAGCGDDGGGGGGGLSVGEIVPPPDSGGSSQALLVQQAADAEHAVDQATHIVNDAILGHITGAATSSDPGGSSVFQTPAISFNFSSSFDLTIDLDAENAAGEDRFPNASGVIDVSVEGTVEGTLAEGEANYSVLITATTDLVFTNPGTDASVTIPGGAFWSWSLNITWSRTDSMNWSVVATAEVSVQVSDMIIDDGVASVTVDVEGTRTVVATLERVDGELNHSRTIEGTLTVSIDDGSEVDTIVIVILGFNEYMVTINGEEFGPLTAAEVRELFDAQFD